MKQSSETSLQCWISVNRYSSSTTPATASSIPVRRKRVENGLPVIGVNNLMGGASVIACERQTSFWSVHSPKCSRNTAVHGGVASTQLRTSCLSTWQARFGGCQGYFDRSGLGTEKS